MSRSHYAILGLPPTATQAEIRHAYRSRIKALHPDTGAHPPAGELERVIQAYSVLSDPEQRQSYDRTMASNATVKPMEKLRALVAQAFSWLEEHNAAHPSEKKKQRLQRRRIRRARSRQTFSRTLNRAEQQHVQSKFIRGEDGIYRRIGQSDPIANEGATLRRPVSRRPAPLNKPANWKLWR